MKLWRLLNAIVRREPWGHICDLWGEFTGYVELRGNPPHQYLHVRRKSLRHWISHKLHIHPCELVQIIHDPPCDYCLTTANQCDWKVELRCKWCGEHEILA